jgi:hypothetical protein
MCWLVNSLLQSHKITAKDEAGSVCHLRRFGLFMPSYRISNGLKKVELF